MGASVAWAEGGSDAGAALVDSYQLIRSETVPLNYVRSSDDDGDIFGFEGGVYKGTGASPGSVWLAPDARKVQVPGDCEAGDTVYSDGLLRQHELPPDSELTLFGRAPIAPQPDRHHHLSETGLGTEARRHAPIAPPV